jgi:hypothetical protein
MKLKKLNNKGSILILAYVFMFALVTMATGFALLNFTELNSARRYHDLTAAFWLAESGLNLFQKDTTRLDNKDSEVIHVGDRGTITLTKNDSNPLFRRVISTGSYAGSHRRLEARYTAKTSDVFDNSMSVNGDLEVIGRKTMVSINQKIRLSGQVVDKSTYSSLFIEDKKERVDQKLVTLTYPDANGNGKADEFSDFVEFNRKLITNYSPDEVVYLKGAGNYTITPQSNLKGKKIIYVEGGEGTGNVLIQFGGSVPKGQNLTVISTGNVTLNQVGFGANNSQLNVIAWSSYNESAALPGSHRGLIYTHGIANFTDIHDTSITNGIVVANGGVKFGDIWSMKSFNYTDVRTNGAVPPGFEGLISAGAPNGYSERPTLWKEI